MNNTAHEFSEIKQIKILTMIWASITGGLLTILIVLYIVLVKDKEPVSFADYQYLSYFSYMAIITAIPGGYYAYDLIMKRKTNSNIKKINLYKMAVIAKYAIFEFAGTMSIIVYAITGRQESLYASGFIIVALLINKPSHKSFLKTKKEDSEKRKDKTIFEPQQEDRFDEDPDSQANF